MKKFWFTSFGSESNACQNPKMSYRNEIHKLRNTIRSQGGCAKTLEQVKQLCRVLSINELKILKRICRDSDLPPYSSPKVKVLKTQYWNGCDTMSCRGDKTGKVLNAIVHELEERINLYQIINNFVFKDSPCLVFIYNIQIDVIRLAINGSSNSDESFQVFQREFVQAKTEDAHSFLGYLYNKDKSKVADLLKYEISTTLFQYIPTFRDYLKLCFRAATIRYFNKKT